MTAHSLSKRDSDRHSVGSGYPNDVERHGLFGEFGAGRPSWGCLGSNRWADSNLIHAMMHVLL